MEIKYLSELHTTPVPRDTDVSWLREDTDKVALTQDFRVVLDGILIIVPEGYVTDGSSIPRFLWFVFNPWVTEARRASCVHDFMYSHLYKSFTKKFADEAFKSMMLHDGASKRVANTFYRAVRLFGKGGWK